MGSPLPLVGAFNFRDLGGYATASVGRWVRYGRVYRSGALHRLVPSDFALLEPLRIETVYDLRSRAEVERDGIGAWVGERTHLHLPLVSSALDPMDETIDWRSVDVDGRYIAMLSDGGAVLRSVLERLAAGSLPAVIHCTGGKDRTGVVIAVLLRALGVGDEDIMADYALSERYLGAAMEPYRERLIVAGANPSAVAYLTSSPPERIASTLSEMDRRWGSTEGYLEAIGVSEPTIRALRKDLLIA